MLADVAIVLFLVGFVLVGFFRGALRQLLVLGAWLVTFVVAAQGRNFIADYLRAQEPDFSVQYAQMLGQPELGDNPAFWRMAYMAGRAADAANAEQQQQPAAATLEGAGGASPAGAADAQKQLVDGILNADGAGRSVLPFG